MPCLRDAVLWRQTLLSLLLPQHTALKRQLEDKLDGTVIRQQAEAGTIGERPISPCIGVRTQMVCWVLSGTGVAARSVAYCCDSFAVYIVNWALFRVYLPCFHPHPSISRG